MTTRKILCPIDFSPGSIRALEAAVRFAARDQVTELVVLHAVSLPTLAYASEYPTSAELMSAQVEAARKELANAVQYASTLGAIRIASKLELGPAWQVIVETLADPSYDVCVIGSQGRTGLSRVLLGSVAEKVIRHASCSILTVHPTGRANLFRHILCPVDFSSSSAHALELAAKLVASDGAITLLHVLELPVRYSGTVTDEELAKYLAPESTGILLDWANKLRAAGVTVHTQSRIGYPGAQILSELEHDARCDLVVLGSHGRTGVARAVLGSVAEKVTRHAPCQVLVARAR
jgi:nucleotide-binding universal stress UspA family protein